MKRAPGPLEVILAGRKPERGKEAVEEVKAEVELGQGHDVSFCQVDWQKPGTLPLDGVDVLLHTAGPFDGEPTVLQEALEKRVPIYVDVADPMSYLDAAEALDDKFRDAECMALCSAGAFPGFSNILAMECAQRLRESGSNELQDLNFSYFTAGLGGSGPVNLLITNLGFGDPVPVFQNGKYAPQMVAGSEMRKVDFFLDEGDPAFKAVGRRDVWSWPFPEAGTVPRRLKIQGNSSTGMGTAPGIWNDILVALVSLVPRELWQQRGFSEALAYFSLPMVWVTDQFVKETHAMRVEATSPDGRNCVCVQTHQSFRRCVAQSAAEFVLHLLERRGFWGASPFPWQPGVYLPERLAEDKEVREELLERLTTTEGTISCGAHASRAPTRRR